MSKSKYITLGILAAAALVLGGYGLYKGVFTGPDLFDAAKTTAAGGDPIKVLCTKYVADNKVVIAPAPLADTVSQSAPGTPVVSPTGTEGVTTTTVTPAGPLPLGAPDTGTPADDAGD